MKVRHILVSMVTLLALLVLSDRALAQGNGADLGFQGLGQISPQSVRGLATGNAYTARSGDIESIYFNPAGLNGIQGFQVSYSAKTTETTLWENKMWGDQESTPLLSMIMDYRFEIDPGQYGVTDDSLWLLMDIEDIGIPEQGVYHYERSAASWIEERSKQLPFNSISAVLPVTLFDQDFVLGGSYSSQYNVDDYDRNDSHTDPFLANRPYMHYNYETSDDTAHVVWSKFTRNRQGVINSMRFALGYSLGEVIQLGLGVNSLSGDTEDELILDKIASLDLWSKSFVFTHDSLVTRTSGTSSFSGFNLDMGFIFDFSTIDFGLHIKLPYRLNRDWSYTRQITSLDSISSTPSNGQDFVDIPASGAVGINIQATQDLSIAFDMGLIPYESATFEYADFGYGDIVSDSTQYQWVDVLSYQVGLTYEFSDFLTLMGGYRSTPLPYVPWGVADKSEGPRSMGLTTGISISVMNIQLDVAYEYQELKYLEPAYAYLNFVTQLRNTFLVGLTYGF
ncbi:MAG: hypothetical protein H8E26_07755 [FCB group bacterium]|nr:hypothetical protein [FCB group bacterium]MBL7120397.1 hypothetical protein [Candidatus Neomarinimicrobiota bacterium]